MTTDKKTTGFFQKLQEFKFPMYNRKSNKPFTAIIKGKNRNDAEEKCKKKFPYPLYDFEIN
jgi:hypothetical protein